MGSFFILSWFLVPNEGETVDFKCWIDSLEGAEFSERGLIGEKEGGKESKSEMLEGITDGLEERLVR